MSVAAGTFRFDAFASGAGRPLQMQGDMLTSLALAKSGTKEREQKSTCETCARSLVESSVTGGRCVIHLPIDSLACAFKRQESAARVWPPALLSNLRRPRQTYKFDSLCVRPPQRASRSSHIESVSLSSAAASAFGRPTCGCLSSLTDCVRRLLRNLHTHLLARIQFSTPATFRVVAASLDRLPKEAGGGGGLFS